jgi:caffeoyl-CoA O-methyltransferase
MKLAIFLLSCLILTGCSNATRQNNQDDPELDQKVKNFLQKHQYRWHEQNIPLKDGQFLYAIVLENKYQNAVEIGTSTGHSAIWIAWALSKTGGKLITIEINETRHQKALASFKEAGLEEYIDARLGDAHQLVPRLKEPVDFVFCDADKSWYTNYFQALEAKIVEGGCFTAHGIDTTNHTRSIDEFLDYLMNHPDFETTVDITNSSGISVSYKKTGK